MYVQNLSYFGQQTLRDTKRHLQVLNRQLQRSNVVTETGVKDTGSFLGISLEKRNGQTVVER